MCLQTFGIRLFVLRGSGLWVWCRALWELCSVHPHEALPPDSSVGLAKEDLQVRAGLGGFVSSWSQSRCSHLITAER